MQVSGRRVVQRHHFSLINERARVLVLGDAGVGKTSLVHLLCHGRRAKNPPRTVGCHLELQHHKSTRSERECFVEYWDICGDPKLAECTSVFFGDCDFQGIILVAEALNKDSLAGCLRWMQRLIEARAGPGFGPGLLMRSGASGSSTLSTSSSGPQQLLAGMPVLLVMNKMDWFFEEQLRGGGSGLGPSSAPSMLLVHPAATTSVTTSLERRESQRRQPKKQQQQQQQHQQQEQQQQQQQHKGLATEEEHPPLSATERFLSHVHDESGARVGSPPSSGSSSPRLRTHASLGSPTPPGSLTVSTLFETSLGSLESGDHTPLSPSSSSASLHDPWARRQGVRDPTRVYHMLLRESGDPDLAEREGEELSAQLQSVLDLMTSLLDKLRELSDDSERSFAFTNAHQDSWFERHPRQRQVIQEFLDHCADRTPSSSSFSAPLRRHPEQEASPAGSFSSSSFSGSSPHSGLGQPSPPQQVTAGGGGGHVSMGGGGRRPQPRTGRSLWTERPDDSYRMDCDLR